MTRMLTAFLGILLVAAPALADTEVKKEEVKKEEIKPDGTKVKTEKQQQWKNDGTGEAKTEVSTANDQTGAQSKKTTKVKRSKNSDGTTETKASTEVQNKQ